MSALPEQSVFRSQVLLLGGYAVRILLAIGITAVVGRNASPQSFGFFALVGSIFFIAHVVFDLGTGNLAAREIGRDGHRERPILEGLMVWRRAAGIGLGSLVAVGALFESDPNQRWVLIAVAVTLPLLAPGALGPVFHVRQRQEAPTLLRTLGQGATLAGAVALAAGKAIGGAFAALLIARELFTVVGLRIFAERELGYRPRARFRGLGLRPFFAMALVYGLAVAVQTITLHADVFLVRGLRGESELGAYAAAFRPVQPLLFLPALALTPLVPVFARLAHSGRADFFRLCRGFGTLLLGVGALIGTLGAVLAPEILGLLYGERFVAGETNAIAAFRWMSAALACSFGANVYTTALLADGHERALLRIRLSGLALNVVGNLALIPSFGFTAAAATTAGTELVVGAACWWRYRRGAQVASAPNGLFLLPALVLAVILSDLPLPAGARLGIGVSVTVLGLASLVTSPSARRLFVELAAQEKTTPRWNG